MAKKDTGAQKPDQAKEGLTPLMQQYREIKARYPGAILFFRLGDFYEMFGEDALRASPLLEVVLTRRQGLPMCGIPYHAVNAYIRKLIKAGEKVAVCEQLEEPGAGRGIVKRDVVRVITPGTVLEDNLLESKLNNYLVALFPSGDHAGLAYVDVSTGEFGAAELNAPNLRHEVARLAPGELIVPQSAAGGAFMKSLGLPSTLTISTVDDWYCAPAEAQAKVLAAFKVQSLKPLGLEGRERALSACGAVLAYLEKTRLSSLPPLSRIRYYSLDDYLLLDETAVRNLELLEGLAAKSRESSLLGVLDSTLTPMGARMLRQWLLSPLLSVSAIQKRQQAVEFILTEGLARRAIREQLKEIADLERIMGRLASGAASPRELVSLKDSLAALPALRQNLAPSVNVLGPLETVESLSRRLTAPQEVIEAVARTVVDEPPATLKDGGVIREGFNAELDELRRISRDSKQLISQMEARERERTGISTLKIGYTSVFGYYLEVSKSNLHLVPQDYIRKQTVASGERFITPELKSFEEKVLSADEKILRLEDALFRKLREEVLAFSDALLAVATAVAELDVYASFAETAAQYQYVRPKIDESGEIDIKDGRHPVIERALKSGQFVANDTYLDSASDQIILLTGPNMAGKSTYLRQTALIVIMAQTGSFVPAREARIGIVDRIFTRIGAGDNLSGGESTFMVEMHETANILNQNTPRSLIILDEVGRGTSTYDGISIARAALEYLSDIKARLGTGPRVLFATHYFELTDLAEKTGNIRNCNVAVKEWRGEVVFLHKIVDGAADRSYGIHVARLAGLPPEVITRAYAILKDLEEKPAGGGAPGGGRQLDMFSLPSPQILVELERLDPDSLTPLEALQLLAQWKKKLKE